VSAARREGMTLICVTLNAPDDWRDHTALFDYGFARYERRCLVREGERVCLVPVQGSLCPMREICAREALWAALAQGESPACELCLMPELLTPLCAGDRIGEMLYTLNGAELGRVRLCVPVDVPCDLAPERSGILGFLGR